MLNDLVEFCDQMGLPVDFSSAGALNKSLTQTFGDDKYSLAQKEVLTNMCSRPMQGLSILGPGPQRTLGPAGAVGAGYREQLDMVPDTLQKQADHCNDRRMASKHVQELSTGLFFAVLVKESGPLESEAMVMGVLNQAFDVLVLCYGVQKRIYCNVISIVSLVEVVLWAAVTLKYRAVLKQPSNQGHLGPEEEEEEEVECEKEPDG
ncbi:hypothetical protein H8958_019037 [Nasalis larvatus]